MTTEHEHTSEYVLRDCTGCNFMEPDSEVSSYTIVKDGENMAWKKKGGYA